MKKLLFVALAALTVSGAWAKKPQAQQQPTNPLLPEAAALVHRAAGREALPAPVQRIDTTRITLHIIGQVAKDNGILYWNDPYTGDFRQIEPTKNGDVFSYKFEQYATQKVYVKLAEGGLVPIMNPGDDIEAWVDMEALKKHDTGARVQYVYYGSGAFMHENNVLSLEHKMGNANAFNDSHMTHGVRLPVTSIENFAADVVSRIEQERDRTLARTDLSGAAREALAQDYVVTGLGAIVRMRTFLQVLGFGQGHPMEANVNKLTALENLNLNDPKLMYGLDFAYRLPALSMAFAKAGHAAPSGWMSWGGALTALKKAHGSEPLSADDRAAVERAAAENPYLKTMLEEVERSMHKQIDEAMNTATFTIRDTPAATNPADVLEAIAANYKGKVVMIDLWATWCGPCLAAMRTIKPLKPWIKEQGVVVAYVTTESSPKARWTLSLPEIGGQHYYIPTAMWKAALEKFGIDGIPAYIIFDREGKAVYVKMSYPGNEAIKAELEKLL